MKIKLCPQRELSAMSVDQRSPEPLRNDISPLLSWLVDGVSPKARFTTATAARMHCRLFDSGNWFVFFSVRLKHLKGNKKRKGERRPPKPNEHSQVQLVDVVPIGAISLISKKT